MKLSLCCYFALSDFFPLGSFYLFAVKKRGHHWVVMLLLFNLTINNLHGFLLTDGNISNSCAVSVSV